MSERIDANAKASREAVAAALQHFAVAEAILSKLQAPKPTKPRGNK